MSIASSLGLEASSVFPFATYRSIAALKCSSCGLFFSLDLHEMSFGEAVSCRRCPAAKRVLEWSCVTIQRNEPADMDEHGCRGSTTCEPLEAARSLALCSSLFGRVLSRGIGVSGGTRAWEGRARSTPCGDSQRN